MKRPKKAKLEMDHINSVIYMTTCPHCNTTLKGGFNADVLMLKCFHCGNPIDFREKGVK